MMLKQTTIGAKQILVGSTSMVAKQSRATARFTQFHYAIDQCMLKVPPFSLNPHW
jgi:hypothetical protein